MTAYCRFDAVVTTVKVAEPPGYCTLLGQSRVTDGNFNARSVEKSVATVGMEYCVVLLRTQSRLKAPEGHHRPFVDWLTSL